MGSTKDLQNLTPSAVTVPCSDWAFLPATRHHTLPSLCHFIPFPHHPCSCISSSFVSIWCVSWYPRHDHILRSKIVNQMWTKRRNVMREYVNPQDEGSLNRMVYTSPCIVHHGVVLENRYPREHRSFRRVQLLQSTYSPATARPSTVRVFYL